MDFDKLLKQASAKQKVAEKKHVLQRQHKEETRKKDLDTQKEEKQKAAAKLREMKDAAVRKQLEYKGLISSSRSLHTSTSSSSSVTGGDLSTSSGSSVGPRSSALPGSKDNRETCSTAGKMKGGKGKLSSSSKSSSTSKHTATSPPIGKHSGTNSNALSSTSPSSSLAVKSTKSGKSSSNAKGINKLSSGENSKSPASTTSKSKSVSNSSTKAKVKPVSGPMSDFGELMRTAKQNTSIDKGGVSGLTKSKVKPTPGSVSQFDELMKTAKQNTSSDRGFSKIDRDNLTRTGKSAMVGGKSLNGGKLKEPPPRSSSPVGRSLLERSNPRSKNKRSYDMMMKGTNPRLSPGPATPTTTPTSRGGSSSAIKSVQTKSVDLARRPLRDPAVNSPAKQNSIKSNSSQLNRHPEERSDKIPGRGGPFSSRGGLSKGQVTSQSLPTSNKGAGGGGGVRGSKASLPPLSSLTPEQIQKLKAARLAAASSKMAPPTKKNALNPNSFYGSAAARILQRKGQPKLSGASGSFKYTSSYVDEMMDYLQSEGMNGVEDLYSDEEDDFIASDDEFIDDSEDYGNYSSVISKIFGYDRSRYADYDDDDRAMESSYAQQEFEEIRSARIGRQEDEEDIRREQQEFVKKKSKKSTKPGPKQTKLSFR